jgi:hypothetical protein
MAEVIDQEHDDRRAHQRADVRLPAKVRFGGTVVDAQAINLSEGGVLLEADDIDLTEGGVLLAGADFPSAAQVKIEIELAELGWHALDAQVVRVTAGASPSLAAAFASAATDGGRDAIRAFFLAHLSS